MTSKICFNAIVRDEESNIIKCLTSCLPYIDAIVISDTGSTDNTAEIIRNFANENNLPLRITFDVWKDYATNRTIALNRAHEFCCDDSWFIMFMDADCVLYSRIDKTDLIRDQYLIEMRRGSNSGVDTIHYEGILLVRSTKALKWRCPVHEFLALTKNYTEARMIGYVDNGNHGYRSKQPDTLMKDIIMLKAGLLDPENLDIIPRIYYYIGRSYYDMKDYVGSKKYYKKVVEAKTGWSEEKYVAALQIFTAEQIEENLPYLYKAITINPERMEAYSMLVLYFCQKENYQMAYTIGYRVMHREERVNASWLHVRNEISNYYFDFWMALAASKCGDKVNALRLNSRALSMMPDDYEYTQLALTNQQHYL